MLRPAIFRTGKPMLLNDSFDRMFQDAFHDFWGNDLGRNTSFDTDILDQGGHYLLQAELPGFQKEDISINLKNDMLTITACHKEDTEDNSSSYIRRERHCSSYTRSFQVENMDANDIDASYNNGILEVKFPKKEPAVIDEAKSIEIK